MRCTFVCFTVFVLTMGIGLADAQEVGFQSFGLRGGVSINPDQFHGGLFIDMGRLFGDVRLQPSFELGWGNGVVLGAVNADALYFFAPRSWRPYAGGGMGLNFVDVTNGVGEGRGLEVEPVLNVVGGVEWGGSKSKAVGHYVVEGRLGIGETPDFKLSFGVRF